MIKNGSVKTVYKKQKEYVMKKVIFLFTILLPILISYEIIAQKVDSQRKRYVNVIPEKTQRPLGLPLPAGTYTIGVTGYFPSIDSAFNKLSIDGISGPVTLELIDDLYQAQNESYFLLSGPIAGASETNRILIRPASNKNVTVEGNGFDVFFFSSVTYLTLDGISLTGNTTMTVRSILNSNVIPAAIDFEDDCDYNIIQNVTVIVEDYIEGWGIDLWVYDPPSGKTPDYNIIQNNLIKSADIGIIVTGNLDNITPVRPINNMVRNNQVGSFTDSLIAWGIQAEYSKGTIIENNVVQNVRYYNDYTNPGINVYCSDDCIVRNNKVHNLKSSSDLGGKGIVLSGGSNELGNNNLIYNNIVSDIQCSSTYPGARLGGIQLWYQNNPKIYFNTVYLTGKGSTPTGSAALFVDYLSHNVDIKNNIFVNVRDESPYCASSIYVRTGSTVSSDYNDLHYIQGPYNCLVRDQTVDYMTLGDWQTTGNDLMSLNEMPFFILPDLHLSSNIASFIESKGIPITGITTDFDGDARNTFTPDLGADEINGTVPAGWQPQYTYQPNNILPVSFSTVTNDICWAAGYTNFAPYIGSFLRTRNGGINWVYSTIPGTENSRSDCIFAKDINTAYIGTGNVSIPGGTGIYKTIDGGLTWQKHPTAFLNSDWEICYIHFFDDNNGVAIGQPKTAGGRYYEIYTTSNDGVDWNLVPEANIPIANINAYVSYPGMSAYGNSIWVPTVANTPLGNPRIYKSTDMGLTWNVIEIVLPNSSSRQYWLGMAFENETTGILTSAYSSSTDAIIKKTTDGGNTWFDINKPFYIISGNSICTIPGVAGGYVVCGDVNDGSAFTLDGGNTWSLIDNKANFLPNFHSATVGWSIEYPSLRIDKYIGPPIPLPVELTSFIAQAENNQVKLSWITVTELNNNGFEIQRKYSGSQFATIGFVKGAGTTTNQSEYTFVDNELTDGKYYYRLKQIDYSGAYEYSDVIEVDVRIIDEFTLEHNFPNPFNPVTTIKYGIKEKSNVKLAVLNAIGEEVTVLVDGEQDRGYYEIEFNAAQHASGVYFYRLQAGDFVQTRKMVLLK